jgi:hypothetical protein
MQNTRIKIKNVLFTISPRPTLGPTQPPIQWVPGNLCFTQVKRQGLETDHSPPNSTEVKKEDVDLYFDVFMALYLSSSAQRQLYLLLYFYCCLRNIITKFVSLGMVCLHTKYHMPKSNISLVIGVMPKANCTGCFKRGLQFWKFLSVYSEDMCSVLNCHNVAKHTEFYLRELRFNVNYTDNGGCFKRSFTTIFQMLLCGECYENIHT